MEAGRDGHPSRRLIIRKMVMENFKSYAGVQEVGPFHKCFSSVVGPNGSGKSNVIDAMLFVFGKRAKQLRLNKVSELIHNSSNHQNLEHAQVSVYFQEIEDLEGDNYIPIPGTDMEVSRIAFRNNTSKYQINGRTSNMTEVTSLLKAKGIDLDNNRFLILQGEVEQIAMMKPKGLDKNDVGLLEYLEDIIGSHVHVEKIEEGAKKLEDLEEKRGSMLERVKHVEKEKDGLEAAKNDAESYMLGELELMGWKQRVNTISLNTAVMASEKIQQLVADIEKKIEEGRSRFAEHQKELERLKSIYNGGLKEHEALEQELEAAKNKFTEFERRDIKHQEDLKHLKQKLKKCEEKKTKAEKALAEKHTATAEAEKSIPLLEERLVKSREDLASAEKEVEKIRESVKGQIESYGRGLSSARAALEPYDLQLNDGRARLNLAVSEKALLVDKHSAAAQQYEAARVSLKDMEASLRTLGENLQTHQAAAQQSQAALQRAKNQEQADAALEAQLDAQAAGLRSKVADMRQALEAERSRGGMLGALLQAKESGSIQGIYGRLGDLGAIDAKYDVAVSTACPALDYIVVEDVEAGQACVELLRSRNLGVGTFLMLDQQQYLWSKVTESVQTPEGVPRLLDLVRVRDERLRPAFYFAMRDTVVAENLDQGTRIAYGPNRRFRKVVTLAGELFEGSGTMSGGGARPRGGKMGTAVVESASSAEALHQAEAELASLLEQLEAVRTRLAASTAELAREGKAVTTLLEVTIPKAEMEIQAVRAKQSDLSQRLGAMKAAAVPNSEELARISTLERAIAQEEKELKKLETASASLRAKVEDLERKIENAGGEDLKRQKELVTSIQKGMDEDTTELNRAQVIISTNEKSVAKLVKSISTEVEEKEKIEGQICKLQDAFKVVENEAFAMQEAQLRMEEELGKSRKELDEKRKDYAKIQDIEAKYRTAELDLQNRLEDLHTDLNLQIRRRGEHEAKLTTLTKDVEKQLAQLLDDGMEEEATSAVLTKTTQEDVTYGQAEDHINLLTAQLKEMKPNLAAIAEYHKKVQQYNESAQELDSVTQERDETKNAHEELKKRRLEEFNLGFNIISLKLKEMYQMITLGGDAELELVDSQDPFNEGVVFSVRPPKKSWKNICNLSGGEKTLSSLALVFALHHYKPTPLYVMDEIDAALDFKNVSIVAHYIKDRTKNAQFIIISLRNNMFELADYLVGIYKTDNCTKSITIDPRSFSVSAAMPEAV